MMKFKYNLKKNAKLLVVATIFLCILYYYKINSMKDDLINKTFTLEDIKKYDYLVRGENCLIPDLPVFSEEINYYYDPQSYKKCSSKELLSYVSKSNGVPELVIRKQVAYQYTKNGLECCFSYVQRGDNTPDPDSEISYSNCKYFDERVRLNETIVLIICRDKFTRSEIYRNTHALTIETDEIRNNSRLKSLDRPMKILLIGIDSISRLNLKRMMPLTHEYLKKNNWIEYQGYNKIDDNTFPNLMAIFTGRNYTHAYKDCPGTEIGNLDKCNFLWYDFKKSGFVTAFIEDLSKLNTFNYYRKGFKKSPTDFYYRPYILASEKLSLWNFLYCTGPENTGERILNLISDYTVTLKNSSQFGFFWMNSFSHEDINHPAMMDEVFLKFFKDLESNGVLDDTMIIFFSDHGIRFGGFRSTQNGWYEERLPFLHFWIPKWFRDKYPKKFENLKSNYNKLTTPYDYYMTLQDLLKIADNNYTILKSSGCPNCHSLFEAASLSRTCEEVAIEQHYCTCTWYKSLNETNTISNSSVNFVLNELQAIINNSKYTKKCAKYRLDKILSQKMSRPDQYNASYLIIEIRTNPYAVFEATLILNNTTNDSIKNLKLSGDISRLDIYANKSKCVDDSILKKYCYCL